MSSQDLLREILGRKLTEQRAESRKASMELPQHLKDGDDNEEDVLKPKAGSQVGFVNQSILGIISKASTNTDFQSRFDESSSDSEDDNEDNDLQKSETVPTPSELPLDESNRSQEPKPVRTSSKSRLFRSVGKLRLKTIRERKSVTSAEDLMSSSQILTPRPTGESTQDHFSHDAPMLSRKLKAEADIQSSEDEAIPATTQHPEVATSPKREPVPLAKRLMEIFDFEEPEQVIAEWKCYLLQSVLLMGYMYVTQRHVCFYAYLPKRAAKVAKSGYFNKRGQHNPRYRRYYFELKGDVLSYYQSPAAIYYPSGKIDLRYGISACISDHKDKTYFTVVTEKRQYQFRADSTASAKEWVKHLQRAIFRSHNDGDIVKISIPTENIIDVEDNPIIEFADTVKIRVFDNDETYAIDEYFFSFTSHAQDAIRVLRIFVDDSHLHKQSDSRASSDMNSDKPEERRSRSSLGFDQPSTVLGGTPLRKSVRATLSPSSPASRGISSTRLSTDSQRSSREISRRSFDEPRTSSEPARRSLSVRVQVDRSRSPFSRNQQDSVSSQTADSPDLEIESSPAVQSLDEMNVSASQILSRSDLFRRPTMYDSRPSVSEPSTNELRRASEDTARSDRASRPEQSEYEQGHKGSGKRCFDGKARSTDVLPTTVVGESSQGLGPLSLTSIQDLLRAGTYPLQRASGLAGFLKDHSKRMSSLVATESMGYYEKVSEMWAGGGRHYSSAEGVAPDDGVHDADDEEDAAMATKRFRDHFALPESEQLLASYYTFFHRVLPLYGKIYISNKNFCFRSLLPGTRTKLLLPLKDIENVGKEKGYRPGYSAMVIVIRGHEEIFFDFKHTGFRDDCVVTLLLSMEAVKRGTTQEMVELFNDEEQEAADAAKAEHDAFLQARKDGLLNHEYLLQSTMTTSDDAPSSSIQFDDPRASILNFKPPESLRITCLTIGSRGDVQPYIALCKRLLAEGHKPCIATHSEFESWIRSYGIDFAPVAGDPAELMRICVENGMFTYSFIREASSKFRDWLDDLLKTAWEACSGTDLLIESPSAMAGIHIAEALEIPYFRAFSMLWTRTRSYPHAFAVPGRKYGGAYNYGTYVFFENLFWKAIAGQVNRWRRKTLKIGATTFERMQQNKVPFLYNFSPHVVIPPLDYSDWIRVTGYWFLDEGPDYVPSKELANFIKKARDEGKKLVYVGFGSIVIDNATKLTETVIESVLRADVRCILSKGWSDRLDHPDATKPEVPLPVEIFQIKAAPHDWLFRQIDAAVHHGGAGTTGASLRAGIPTVVKPFFGDQYFSAIRVEDLGVGIHLKKLNSSLLAKALWEATHSERMLVKARLLGEQIRSEDGVGTAIKAIYRDLEYARSLIKHRDRSTPYELDEGLEETWTFIGDDSDPELVTHRYAHEWDPNQLHGGVKVGVA